ncbi:hypothetical protein DFP72DRAFT_1065129 [Ephemerocybe angulata]|uniref:Uncharacterized protein n=1 Tax=Ephemerocybe angulata TaxID=980116 RepID=A0A8H6I397_9AGAR|nr:hypothetical protein DFP72DRAFT_1065129 [Tulosesus angulatus]
MVTLSQSARLRRAPSERKPARKVVRRKPAIRNKKTKAERDATKARNAEVRQKINDALEAERKAIWARAEELHTELGQHTVKWWHDAIIQAAGKKNKRVSSMTRWRGWVSKRVREMNDKNREALQPSVKPAQVSKELAIEWNAFTTEEKAAQVDDYIAAFEAERDEATSKVQNVPIASFNDFRANFENMRVNGMSLFGRTGVELLCIAVRTELDQFNRPAFFATTERTEKFFLNVFKTNLHDLAERYEAYMISGVNGVRLNYVESLIALRSETAKLIHTKLNEAAGQIVPKMIYSSFASRITARYHIVVKGWPLKTFQSPSDTKSRVDVEILRKAWAEGTAYFERLSDEEYAKFCEAFSKSGDQSPGVELDEEEEDNSTDAVPTSEATSAPPLTVPAVAPTLDSGTAAGPLPSPPTTNSLPTPTPTSPIAAPPASATSPATIALPAVPAPSPSPATVPTAAPAATSSTHHQLPEGGAAPPPSKRRKTAQAPAVVDPFIVTVAGVNGPLQAGTSGDAPKRRRSDFGVKRGPRRPKSDKENGPPTASPMASTTSHTFISFAPPHVQAP